METEYIIETKDINKSFPGVHALKDVNFNIIKGQIHAIVGENGAGKSTLIKIFSGIYAPEKGELIFDGKKVEIKSPNAAKQIGINVVHQELQQVPAVSVAENIFLGKPIMRRILGIPFVDWRNMYKSAKKILDELEINLDVKQNVENLSVAHKQIIEICKAITQKSKLIIMDEPSATLTENELRVLFSVIKKLKKDGVTVVYISHRLEEVFEIADRVTVLRDGMHIETCDIGEMDRKKLISMMVGRELTEEYPKDDFKKGEVILEVNNLNRKGVLKDISFKVNKGEILGIAGLVGSGRTELARAVLGIDPIDSGEILVNGKKVGMKNFSEAIKHKMALVPEDRRRHGIIPQMDVSENVTIVGIQKIIDRLFISSRKQNEAAKKFVKMLSISTPSLTTIISNLSGGNQQKVVMSKWLFVDMEIILLDEPTRGIDVGAKFEIYKILNNLAKNGIAVIMISSELSEIIGMSDRIIVMHDGQIKGELGREEADQEKIMHLCVS